MRTVIIIFAFLSALTASADDLARCGTDAFGNTVCMDKNGVLTNSPKKAAKEKSGGETSGKGAPASTGAESGNKADNDETGPHVRCGTDQFGNTVCMNN